ncbi:MAG TPA: nitrate reductase molybdenum cofactor assembly chaperone [Anaerolineae bacterium]|nr:nitrate reductase molybdenum cofactor assembly chaperone [Anaerolineae bacterium]
MKIDPRIFQLLADVLDYPQPGLIDAARECEDRSARLNAASAASVHEFITFAEALSLERLQEIYTSIFELNATCHPYVGYHLFGESYKRSVFLLGLKERFDARGFSYGTELPDHLVVLLRFLALCDDDALADELIRVAMLPALEKMIGAREARQEGDPARRDDPDVAKSGYKAYQDVLHALRTMLRAGHGEPIVPAMPLADSYPVMIGD